MSHTDLSDVSAPGAPPGPPPDPAPDEALVLMVTAPDGEIAARLGRALVEEQLAACVNVLPGLRSIYRWQGQVNDEPEVLCLVKTRRALYDEVRTRLADLHPYEVPEILALAPAAGNAPYLRWLFESTRAPVPLPAGPAGPPRASKA